MPGRLDRRVYAAGVRTAARGAGIEEFWGGASAKGGVLPFIIGSLARPCHRGLGIGAEAMRNMQQGIPFG
jgi:hypothetical protein